MDWRKLRLRHRIVSLLVASIGACIVAIATFLGSDLFFKWKYPHDAMDGLGAIFHALMAMLFSWGILYWQSMKWQHIWAWRKQQLHQVEEMQQKHTITGRTL